jgi:hypothetical protein
MHGHFGEYPEIFHEAIRTDRVDITQLVIARPSQAKTESQQPRQQSYL